MFSFCFLTPEFECEINQRERFGVIICIYKHQYATGHENEARNNHEITVRQNSFLFIIFMCEKQIFLILWQMQTRSIRFFIYKKNAGIHFRNNYFLKKKMNLNKKFFQTFIYFISKNVVGNH